MKIPTKFYLFGKQYEVVFDNDKCADKDAWGVAEYRENRIYLADKNNGTKMTENTIYHTFLHELTHCIIFEAGLSQFVEEDKMEHFVDLFGNCLHQTLKTAEYV